MGKRIARISKFVLIFAVIVVGGFIFFNFFFVKAQEQIKIFPSAFSGNPAADEAGWQNPGAALFQNLGENAAFEEFNAENSAYLLPAVAGNPKSEILNPKQILNSLDPKSQTLYSKFYFLYSKFFKNLARAVEHLFFFKAWAEELVTVNATSTPEATPTPIETPTPTPAPELTPEPTPTPVPEATPEPILAPTSTPEATPTPTFAPCDLRFAICSPLPSPTPTPETLKEIKPTEKILELSNFSVSGDFLEKQIKMAQLGVSLAAKPLQREVNAEQDVEQHGKLLLEYFYQGSWQNLQEFDLSEEISNAKNNGYFLFALPIFENWEDIENLKIRFIYRGITQNNTQNNAESSAEFSDVDQILRGSAVFLDAAWLEVKYDNRETDAKQEHETDAKLAEVGSLRAEKKSFRLDEEPEFNLKEMPFKKENLLEKIISLFKKDDISAVLIDPEGKEDREGIIIQGDKIKISKPDKRNFKPGLYKLKIKKGEEEIIQEFTWGVLAINTNKSIYLSNKARAEQGLPPETAYLQMAALEDNGYTICNAELKLQITNHKSQITILSTGDGTIQYSGKCGANNVTDVPDYFAYYSFGVSQNNADSNAEQRGNNTGVYQMRLINLDNGYEITDSFEVRDSVPFEIERIGPTRIYPLAIYEMVLKIKANQDFVGQVIETVPARFDVLSAELTPISTLNNAEEFSVVPREVSRSSATITTKAGAKVIFWQVSWRAGEEYELKYQFDAPDISPELYLLGPLSFVGKTLITTNINTNEHENISGNLVFSEARQWQIASDVATPGNSHAYYIDTTLASPNQLRIREYASSTSSWGTENSAGRVTTTTINNIVVESSPTRDEKLIAVWADTATVNQSELRLFNWNGSTTTLIYNTTVGTDFGTTTPAVDIAYEYGSGRALIIYTKGQAPTNEIAYIFWNGIATSSEQLLDATGTTAVVCAVEAVSRGGASNEIALLYQVNAATYSLNAAVWNGSTWESNPTTALEAGAMDLLCRSKNFDIEFEDISGEIMAAWGGGATINVFRYATSTASSPRTWGATTNSATAEEGTVIDLDRRKATNQIFAVMASDNGNDTGAGYWSGTAWTVAAGLDTTNGGPAATFGQQVSAGWLEAGGNVRAIGVYGDAAAIGLDYVLWNNSALSLPTDLCTTGPPSTIEKQIKIKQNPFDKSWLLVLVKDANADLYSYKVTFDGTNLGCTYLSGAVLNANVGVNTDRSFDFDYNIPDIAVGATGAQVANMTIPSAGNNIGGAFSFIRNSAGPATATQIIITASGTVAYTNITNLILYYKQETTCSASFPDGTTVFNTAVNFNSAMKATTTGAMVVNVSQICVYAKLNIGAGASTGQTLDIQINNPSADITISNGTVSPATLIGINGVTTLQVVIISISVSDGVVDYGNMNVSQTKNTVDDLPAEQQKIVNNGNIPETFSIKGSTSTPGNWTLSTGPGSEIYRHQFSTTTGSFWVNMTATGYTYATSSVAVGATSTLDLKIFTPTDTTNYNQNNINVTVQATAT